MQTSTHRWVLDQLEESSAAVEIDGGTMITVPRWLLPEGAREGQVLRVTHDRPPNGARSALTIEIDESATRQTLAESAAQVKKGTKRPNDPGGNIVL